MVEVVTGALIGYRLVKNAKFIVSIAQYIKNYQGYNSKDNKEDDRAIRNWIMESINGLKTKALNLMENGYRNDDEALEKDAKIMIDNLDLFKNEVNLATDGQVKSVWEKVSDEDFDNLVEFDLKIVEGIGKVNNKMSELIVEVETKGENKMKLISEIKNDTIVTKKMLLESDASQSKKDLNTRFNRALATFQSKERQIFLEVKQQIMMLVLQQSTTRAQQTFGPKKRATELINETINKLEGDLL